MQKKKTTVKQSVKDCRGGEAVALGNEASRNPEKPDPSERLCCEG